MDVRWFLDYLNTMKNIRVIMFVNEFTVFVTTSQSIFCRHTTPGNFSIRAFILFVSKYFHIVSRFSSLFLTMICKYFFKIPLDN